MPNKFEDNKRLQERCKLTNFVCKKCGRRVMEISKKRESLNAKVKSIYGYYCSKCDKKQLDQFKY